jgi:hypothetical protein
LPFKSACKQTSQERRGEGRRDDRTRKKREKREEKR